MSKGIGKLQRHILDRLAEKDVHGPVSSFDLAYSIRGAQPTRSERVSVRRALRTLEARGLITVDSRPRAPDDRRIGGEELDARLALSEEQSAAGWENARKLLRLAGVNLRD
jgi:hypothetical protein